MFEALDEVGLLQTMRQARHRERVAVAERVLASGRLIERRIRESDTDNREQWCVDNWEAVAAEVGAELSVSQYSASLQMGVGLELIERLPKLAAVFAAGEVEYAVIRAILFRTGLIVDDDALALLDERLSRSAPKWNMLSRNKITDKVDWMVRDLDPDAVRNERRDDADRHIEFGRSRNGLSELSGSVRASDAAAFDRKLDQLATTVCPDDPRTKAQRRADAVGAIGADATALECGCGSEQCPVRDNSGATSGQIVIHLVAETKTVAGESDTPGYLPEYGPIPADIVRDLATRAKLRPVIGGKELSAEPNYRPSAALAEFIRCRDLTCRFPGCDRPAEVADIDHTVPYPLGPTHPSNLKLLCRLHHLLKTFYTGPRGWADRQLPDGTVIWTSPSGRTYTTKPHGALFFPQLAEPTGELVLPDSRPPLAPGRGLMMPTRRRTRAQERAARIKWERGLNEARRTADPPPF